MELEFIRASDGTEIEITKDMLQDLYVLSGIYSVSIKDLIRNIFDGELGQDSSHWK